MAVFTKNISSQDLLEKAKTLVAEERKVTLALIQCLEEIQSRMLYAELGYASLWEFATKYLGLSEGAAQRRIQAMRLARDVPEIKASLADGKPSLSNAAKVQSFRQAEKKAGRKHDPRTLIHAVSELTQRECEQKLFEISPQALPQERERQVSAQGEREIKVVISAELHEKLQRIRGIIAHAKPEASYAELLELMANETLARLEKKHVIYAGASSTAKKKDVIRTGAGDFSKKTTVICTQASDSIKKTTVIQASVPESSNREIRADATGVLGLDARPSSTAAAAVSVPPPGVRGYLPVAFRTALGARSQGRCESVTASGRRCNSRYRLQVDHKRPLAFGGSNELANLQVVCAIHNRQRAVAMGLRSD